MAGYGYQQKGGEEHMYWRGNVSTVHGLKDVKYAIRAGINSALTSFIWFYLRFQRQKTISSGN
jgi:hypothetical protein